MRPRLQAIAALATLTLGAGSLPSARFHGLSAGDTNAFTSSPDGSALSILFDNFKLERIGDAPLPKHPSERHFTLAATPAAAGCRASLTLRGAALAANTPRAGTITLTVGGRKTVLRPTEGNWTLTERVALATGERTDVTITLDLPPPDNKGTLMLAIDSVDVSIGKCGARR